MHFLRVLIQHIHNLPLLFVFPEVFGWQRCLQTPEDSKRRGDTEWAETKQKDSLLHSLKCKEDGTYGTFTGTFVNYNYQLQNKDVRCTVVGRKMQIKRRQKATEALKYLCELFQAETISLTQSP